MGKQPSPHLMPHRIALAKLIRFAKENAHRASPGRDLAGKPWTFEELAEKIPTDVSNIKGWCDITKPVVPGIIVPLINQYYGDNPDFAAERNRMESAWRRARGYFEAETAERPISRIETKEFSDDSPLIRLLVAQPESPNNELIVTFDFVVRPDPNLKIGGLTVELGVSDVHFIVESAAWEHAPDSPMFHRQHRNIDKDVPVLNGVAFKGPRRKDGLMDGEPLEGERRLAMQPRYPGADGPVTLSVHVPEYAFSATSHGASKQSDTQKTVIDAIFNGAFRKDSRDRLIAISKTVIPPISKITGK